VLFRSIGSNALIYNANKEILLIKRSEGDDAFPGEWELPGGGTNYGETPQESLKREIQEECGLDVIVGKPLGVHTYSIKDQHFVEITFLCTFADNKDQVHLSHEHSDFQWILPYDLTPMHLNDYMTSVVIDAIKTASP